jgi:hypothetical protein
MKCFICKKDKSYFDMHPVQHRDVGLEVNPHAIPADPKPLVCHVCLGWKEERTDG